MGPRPSSGEFRDDMSGMSKFDAGFFLADLSQDLIGGGAKSSITLGVLGEVLDPSSHLFPVADGCEDTESSHIDVLFVAPTWDYTVELHLTTGSSARNHHC